jgi:hypothetical protein
MVKALFEKVQSKGVSPEITESTLYISDKKLRFDTEAPEGKMSQPMRLDEGKMYNIMWDKKTVHRNVDRKYSADAGENPKCQRADEMDGKHVLRDFPQRHVLNWKHEWGRRWAVRASQCVSKRLARAKPLMAFTVKNTS